MIYTKQTHTHTKLSARTAKWTADNFGVAERLLQYANKHKFSRFA